jgi:hypothetical protein
LATCGTTHRLTSSVEVIQAVRVSSVRNRGDARGRGEQLSEQRIGIHVFDRKLDYDSADDNIVRSHASRLRQRLEAYFHAEGRDETLRLELRRGSYIPNFEAVSTTLKQTQVSHLTENPVAQFQGLRSVDHQADIAGELPQRIVLAINVPLRTLYAAKG